MSLFDWLSPKKKSARVDAPISSGLSRMDSTRPVLKSAKGRPQPEGQPGKPANRKHERMARRELLYGVVRECMANAGVVSASYKFKVLSLDPRGRQFLVMVDLSRTHASDTIRLAEIEAMVAQAAKSRYDILITAVYWRTIEHVAVGIAATPVAHSKPAPLISQPMPIEASEPPEDRKAAFARTFDGAAKQGPQNYTLLTGFEDTELPDPEVRPALSATQYGELR